MSSGKILVGPDELGRFIRDVLMAKGARQRDALDRQFLIVHAIGCKTGEQDPDERDKANDETQPNHSLTRK